MYAIIQFDYLTDQRRPRPTTNEIIIKHFNNGTLAKLIKRYDPISFYMLKNN